MAAAVLLAALLAVAVVAWVLFPPSEPRRPPCIGSRVPCLGAAFRLARAPLEFIERARAEVRLRDGARGAGGRSRVRSSQPTQRSAAGRQQGGRWAV